MMRTGQTQRSETTKGVQRETQPAEKVLLVLNYKNRLPFWSALTCTWQITLASIIFVYFSLDTPSTVSRISTSVSYTIWRWFEYTAFFKNPHRIRQTEIRWTWWPEYFWNKLPMKQIPWNNPTSVRSVGSLRGFRLILTPSLCNCGVSGSNLAPGYHFPSSSSTRTSSWSAFIPVRRQKSSSRLIGL